MLSFPNEMRNEKNAHYHKFHLHYTEDPGHLNKARKQKYSLGKSE